mmetsp:Transcript_102312/g.295985  ORF Transcript_102312/g.295985 Transcript_102312/m.295985 type:complete len:517 (+) Transcript_102312:74-1624(+)
MPTRSLLLGLALSSGAEGFRASTGVESNLTADASFGPAIPEIPDGTAEAISEWWKTANKYVGHKYVLAFSDCWTIYNNLKKIKSVAGQKKAAASFVVTGEYFTTLEAARDVDRSFTSALGIKTSGESSWSCDQYYPDEDQPKMRFDKTSFLPTETFESVNDAKCLNTLKSQIGIIRWSICHIEAQAKAWAEEMATTDLKKFFLDMVRGKTCEGKALDEASLSPEFRGKDGEKCVAHKDKVECAEECDQNEDCSAVSYKAKTRECCFLEGDVAVKPGSSGEQCFEKLGSRDHFLMLDPAGVGEWLKSKGFEAYDKNARTYGGHGLTGIVIAFMTEPTLQQWLGVATPKEAKVLRCKILAQLDNDPDRDCGFAPPPPGLVDRASALSPIKSSHIDHGLLWPKGANGKWYGVKWVSDFMRRYAPSKDMKAWSTAVYDLSATWLNANGFHKIVSGGPAGLVSPFVALKSISTSTGLMKFRQATSFVSCESVKKQLDPVISQLQAVPMKQTSAVKARVLGK